MTSLKNNHIQYFNDRRFSKGDVQILFCLKTKMTNCKANFKSQFGSDLTCRICKETESYEDKKEQTKNHIM